MKHAKKTQMGKRKHLLSFHSLSNLQRVTQKKEVDFRLSQAVNLCTYLLELEEEENNLPLIDSWDWDVVSALVLLGYPGH